ncbi:cytochrome c, 3 heme-binding sites [Geotalea daltonii FRC-32]|uniref:Cytochrome c, 3 heme-binding sites n=1 Tax=Geotalea daltonii (strain DSM 22248 / JCM 15807 / FRC-32) TaxID=316067 RepID=B9M0E4_GEODF|nr:MULTISPECIES: cytochrome c3 family protein [Geotalea]ACM18981.1 cytochrome c, 3 heme-binding sites [Geotalea daltonii FRC-32]
MKKVLAVVLMVAFSASAAFAADTVVMKAKNGNVTFDHKKHSASGDCKSCHGEGTPAKLTLGKDAAHKLCKGCHETKKAGPTKCGECHKK